MRTSTTHMKLLYCLMGLIIFLISVRVHAASEGENNDVMGKANMIQINQNMSGVTDNIVNLQTDIRYS